MDAMQAGGELTVVDYLRPVWRFKFIVALVVALAAAGTYLYSNRKAKVYDATTQVYVGQSSLQQLLTPIAPAQSDRTVADQALLVTTPAVAAVVRARYRLTNSLTTLISEISVVPDATTDFLTVTARSGNPNFAAMLANGFAQAYLEVAGGSLVDTARSSLRSLEDQLGRLGGGSAHAAVRAGLRAQITALETIVASPPSAGRQLAPALVPATPVSPKPARDGIFAGALALVLAVICSYLLDRSDRRVRRLDELESLFDLPVLASVPHVRDAGPPRDDPHGSAPGLRESLRSLRVNLEMARVAPDSKVTNVKVIMIASGLPAEGKSTMVRNLAISYREAGARVAIIEADLRRPVLAAQLGLDSAPGLGEALYGGSDLRMQRVLLEGDPHDRGTGVIDVAVAGTADEDPTVLLTDERLRRPILRLRGEYDVVLVDSPPLLPVSDGLPLLGIADGVLLVARVGTITRQAAARLLATIERVNRIQHVNLLGIVVNDVGDELASYYGRRYGEAPGRARRARDAPAL